MYCIWDWYGVDWCYPGWSKRSLPEFLLSFLLWKFAHWCLDTLTTRSLDRYLSACLADGIAMQIHSYKHSYLREIDLSFPLQLSHLSVYLISSCATQTPKERLITARCGIKLRETCIWSMYLNPGSSTMLKIVTRKGKILLGFQAKCLDWWQTTR